MSCQWCYKLRRFLSTSSVLLIDSCSELTYKIDRPFASSSLQLGTTFCYGLSSEIESRNDETTRNFCSDRQHPLAKSWTGHFQEIFSNSLAKPRMCTIILHGTHIYMPALNMLILWSSYCTLQKVLAFWNQFLLRNSTTSCAALIQNIRRDCRSTVITSFSIL